MAGGTLVSAVTTDRAKIANLFISFTIPLQRPASNTARKDAAAL